MFKFMKSKKGFTLVELMIVVVIMAILVAVAVPIYSAVTANARRKTCIANQRELVGTVANWFLNNDKTISSTVTFKVESTGFTSAATNSKTAADVATVTSIEDCFQTIPSCPEDGAVIWVTCTKETDTVKVTTECTSTDDHVL